MVRSEVRTVVGCHDVHRSDSTYRWRCLRADRYGGDPGIVGTDIGIDGQPHTVVGVMAPQFRQPERTLSCQATELWRPMLLDTQRDTRNSRCLRTVAMD